MQQALKRFAITLIVCDIDYNWNIQTASALSWFMLAMVLFPEVQKRAQAELDEVVGRAQLPNFAHYDSLPYIQAVIQETLRWKPIVPFSIPHSNTEDDIYEGYYIPKGSICIPNMW